MASHHAARPVRHLFPTGNASYSDSYYPPYQHYDLMPRAPPQFSVAKLLESNNNLMNMLEKMSKRITKIEETLVFHQTPVVMLHLKPRKEYLLVIMPFRQLRTCVYLANSP